MKLHLSTKLKAALLAAVLSAGSYPALGVTSTTTEYTYTPAGGTEQTITFNGDIWTWNNYRNNGADGQNLSNANCRYTKYGTTTEVAGNTDMDPAPNVTVPFYNVFFDGNETDRVGNTLRFSGATSDIRLNTDWTNYVWIGGLITEASDKNITYTFGRSSTTNFKLKGTRDVNLLLNSSFTLLTNNSSSVSVEKGGTWTIASGKTFTITANKTTLATNQAVNINGGGTVAIGSALETQSGSSINVAAGSTLAVSGATINEGTLENEGTANFTGSVTNTGAITNSGTMTFSGAVTDSGTITNNGNLTFNGALTLGHTIANNDGASLAINGEVRLSAELVMQQRDSITRYSDGTNGFAQGQFVIVSGSGATTLGANAFVMDSTNAETNITTLDDGSLATASDFKSNVYFVNEGNKAYAAASDLPAGLYIAEGASAEVTGTLTTDVNDVYGSGDLTVHLATNGTTAMRLGLENFSGKLRVEGTVTRAADGSITQQARGLLHTENVVGDNVTVELGTRGQLCVTNNATFANDIVIDSNVDTSVADAFKSRIYTNSGTSGTLTGSIILNGKTLYKEGGGTLYIKGDKAINSLLRGSEGSTLAVESGGNGFGGTVQIGELDYISSESSYTTNLEVNNSTLKLAISKGEVKTFNGTLTLTNGAVVELLDGTSKFTGAISLGSRGNTIRLSADWGKGGIELAGMVSGAANVYLVGGGSLDNKESGYQTINISGSDNAFNGTYFVGANSAGNASVTKVHLIAGTKTSLAHASVNLSGGDKAVLELATASATVAGLDGTAGSSIITTATNGATLTVNGGGSYAGSFNSVNLTKQGAEETLTLTANSLTNAVSVEGGTLSLTAAGLTWGEGSSVTVHSGNSAKLVMGANQGITVTAHAPAVSTFAASDANAATVTGDSISNADITLTSADDHISQKVTDSSITNNSGAKQTVEVGASLAEVFANTGDIDLLTGDASTLTATQVHIGNGRTVGVYQGTTGAPGDNMASLNLGSLVTDGLATLNANVASLDALTLGGVLTLGSASLELGGATISLSNEFAANLITGEGEFTLIEGLSGLSYEGAILNTGNLSGNYAYSLGTVAGDDGTSSLVITAKLVPEPATATLSLLALVALAARRRRK